MDENKKKTDNAKTTCRVDSIFRFSVRDFLSDFPRGGRPAEKSMENPFFVERLTPKCVCLLIFYGTVVKCSRIGKKTWKNGAPVITFVPFSNSSVLRFNFNRWFTEWKVNLGNGCESALARMAVSMY